LRAIDLFCGIGGNSCGARQAGVDIVAGFDKWDLAGKVYQQNFPEARFCLGDLAEYSQADLESLRREFGPIDLILASPECTSHSVARGGKPKDGSSLRLSWHVWRFARVFQPRWIVIENVTAMKSWDSYALFLQFLHEKEHYHFLEQPLLASNFGVPQRRRRLYILFDKKAPPKPIVPTIENEISIKNVIDQSEQYAFSPLVKDNRAKKTLDRASRAFQSIGYQTPFLMVYYGTDAAGGWQTLETPLRTITTLDRFALVRPDGKGGHEMRMLQPTELQAAMGFPKDFLLSYGSRRDKVHLLGNAVCPPVMRAIVETLLDQTDSKPEEAL